MFAPRTSLSELLTALVFGLIPKACRELEFSFLPPPILLFGFQWGGFTVQRTVKGWWKMTFQRTFCRGAALGWAGQKVGAGRNQSGRVMKNKRCRWVLGCLCLSADVSVTKRFQNNLFLFPWVSSARRKIQTFRSDGKPRHFCGPFILQLSQTNPKLVHILQPQGARNVLFTCLLLSPSFTWTLLLLERVSFFNTFYF